MVRNSDAIEAERLRLLSEADHLLNMIYGGEGVGFVNLIIFAILSVFLTRLMVGRTPDS